MKNRTNFETEFVGKLWGSLILFFVFHFINSFIKIVLKKKMFLKTEPILVLYNHLPFFVQQKVIKSSFLLVYLRL